MTHLELIALDALKSGNQPNACNSHWIGASVAEVASRWSTQGDSMSHDQFRSCIEACNECAIACSHCSSACLQEPDPKSMARCIALDIDCAEICRLAAAYMSRGSEFAGAICGVCAEVCDACATECEKHEMDHCKVCAEACRRCAEECRRMSTVKGAGQKDQSRHAGH